MHLSTLISARYLRLRSAVARLYGAHPCPTRALARAIDREAAHLSRTARIELRRILSTTPADVARDRQTGATGSRA